MPSRVAAKAEGTPSSDTNHDKGSAATPEGYAGPTMRPMPASNRDPLRARSFGGVAEAYHRGRPSYPDDAVAWLVGEQPVTVLEVGAGTGKLTERLVAAGHDVHATEPDPGMLDVLSREIPAVKLTRAAADDLPTGDASVDVVVAAQCYHWFDPEVVLPEIARVLRPGGHVSVVWNERDERIPWVRRLGRIIGTPDAERDPTADLEASGLFDEVETASFVCWQTVDRVTIQDLARSRSNVALLDEAERERVIAELLALYDDYGRGMDGMQLPYRTRCFRARVRERVVETPVEETTATGEAEDGEAWRSDSATTLPRVAVQPVDDGSLLLIDFR